MIMYQYNKIYKQFKEILETNYERAKFKKAEYLDKIVSIFKQFVSKCQKQIDYIIAEKINKLQSNYAKVSQYIQNNINIDSEQKNIIIAQFLIKPFQKFPFTGHKNQKLFKEQYNLIQKASVLIQQTLIESFKEDQVPQFENIKFFQTILQNGIGNQSITKLRLNPQNFNIQPIHEITPYQSKITSLTKLNKQTILCIGDQSFIQVWDILENYCMKKFNLQLYAPISTVTVIDFKKCHYLSLGFSDENPMILLYRLDTWTHVACNLTHTRKITKLLEYRNKTEQYLISGSADGLLCLHDLFTLKTYNSSSHVSGIEDIFAKSNHIYVLQKNSSVLEYEVCINVMSFNFKRSISAGYISMIRFPELTTNFSGIGCHIYGLSQIQITRKFKIQQANIINVPQMISDFILLQSKETSQYFALCVFQNSSAIRIFSLTTQQQVYEYALEYTGEVGASGYLPKMEITWINGRYVLVIVSQSQFQDDPNIIKCYQLSL